MDKFILERGTEVSRPTLNKDIRNLKKAVCCCIEANLGFLGQSMTTFFVRMVIAEKLSY